MTRILFIPEVEWSRTSERTPLLYKMFQETHEVVGLRSPWDRKIYDPSRPRVPRYLLYLVDRVLLTLRGIRLAHARRSEVVFCATAHHAVVGLVIAKVLGIRCVWDSQGNVRLFAESVGKGKFFTLGSVLVERFLGKHVDALITVTERDAQAYVEMRVPASKIHLIPIFVDLATIAELAESGASPSAAAPSAPHVPVLLFFGSFKYAPNLEALEYIDGILAPYLEKNGMRCDIQIAGRDLPERTYHPYLHKLGFVAPIYGTIRAADLCIVPIWKGVGTLTKVLDAMAAGTVQVLSSFAADLAPGVRDRVHAFVAPTPEAFPPLVLEALKDHEACEAVARNAQGLVAERYDMRRYADRLDLILAGESTSSFDRGRSLESRDHHV